MKTVLKFVYILIALIATVIVYVMGYNSNSINHIVDMTNNALANKDYVQLARIHGGCFDINNLSKENVDDLDLIIFPSTTLSSYSYYKDTENKETIQSSKYDKSYYIYIANPTYALKSNELNGSLVNDAAIKFTSGDSSYTYILEVSETVNSKLYNKTPYSISDIVLGGQRQSLTYYDNWGFINLTLSETIIDEMNLSGAIDGIEILDRNGKLVYSEDINLDFSQQFFTDVDPLCKNYNTYIETINGDDEEAKKNAETVFNEFYEGTNDKKGFEAEFLEHENYSFRLADSKLQPGSLVWQTIGIVVLFVVVVVLLYILLFHFQFIKALLSRENKGKGYRVNAGTAKKRESIDAKVKPATNNKPKEKQNSKKEEVKPVEEAKPVVEVKPVEEVKTEEVEEITAEEVSSKNVE